MNLLFVFDPLLIFSALLTGGWLILAVVGIFRRFNRQESFSLEE